MSVVDSSAKPVAAGMRRGRTLVSSVMKIREFNVLVALLLIGALISLATPYFLTVDNLMGVFRAFSLTAIMSDRHGDGHHHRRHRPLGRARCMGLSSLITALCFAAGFATPVADCRGLGVGLAFGASNGLLDHRASACRPSSLRSARSASAAG